MGEVVVHAVQPPGGMGNCVPGFPRPLANTGRLGGIQASYNLPTTGKLESADLELGDLSLLQILRYAAVQPTTSPDNFDCV